VSSKDHSRRLRRVLDRVMNGDSTRVMVHPERYSSFDPERWWETRSSVRTEIVELQKLSLDVVLHPIEPRCSPLVPSPQWRGQKKTQKRAHHAGGRRISDERFTRKATIGKLQQRRAVSLPARRAQCREVENTPLSDN
jgi:hypothetical protein